MITKKPISEETLKDIKKKFGFLFERGYTIHSAHSINDPMERHEGWEVIVKRQDFHIWLWYAANFGISFGSPSKGFKNIRSLIYFLSDEKEFINPFILTEIFFSVRKEANLLQKYIEKFESLYGSDFQLHEEDMNAADKKFLERLDQSFSLPVGASTPAPKKITVAAVIKLFTGLSIAFALFLGTIFNWFAPELNSAITVVSFLLAMWTLYWFDKRQ